MGKDTGGVAAFTGLTDLASDALGGEALLCSDDFFAGKENLVRAEPAAFDPDAYTDRGKEMDGWESRRRRVPGHDWCIVRLGVPGIVRAVDVDTSFFLGNQPPFASIDACRVEGDPPGETLRDEAEWTRILGEVPLAPGTHNVFATDAGLFTHLRLNIYPDGGVARLRAYGDPAPPGIGAGEVDLAAAASGGRVLAASDSFFSPMGNLVLPGRPRHMGEGWETRRRRGPGNDWILVRLGVPGRLDRLVVDTCHFKGNFPDRVRVRGIWWPEAPATALLRSPDWVEVLPETKLRADDERVFEKNALASDGPFTHLLLDAIPCGGVARLRAFGSAAAPDADPDAAKDPLLRALNDLGPGAAIEALLRCCASARWAKAMAARRPFASRAALFGEAEIVWWHLDVKDWQEAFAHHPRIGSDLETLRKRHAGTASWAEGEQSGVQGADEETLRGLAEGNRAYEARFGHVFLVCATGRSAAEMLRDLRTRMENPPENELRVAAGEQAKITRLRLQKLEAAP